MMLGIAVFVLHASPEVVSAPNLQYPCINHFRQCIQSENVLVRNCKSIDVMFALIVV